MTQLLMRQKGYDFFPSETDYALRYEGTIELTASQFQQELHEHSVNEVLGINVRTDEIVEIDDGLMPYYFFFSAKRIMPHVIYFRGEKARENKLERPPEDDDLN